MELHKNQELFQDLCVLTSDFIGIPYQAVKRDYFIVNILEKLVSSEYREQCVFKGGTSLSKAYPNSINRFSEDIDLTYVPNKEISARQYDKDLKRIETIMSEGMNIEKIANERSDYNKSSYIWFSNEREDTSIKLEIGSTVRPDPFSKRKVKTYIQEYLESIERNDIIEQNQMCVVNVNVLNIERTFIDKIMSIKRHAMCGTLDKKVRHIYDVVALYTHPTIKIFLENKNDLKKLIKITKETDAFYFEKRNMISVCNPLEKYDFNKWKKYLDSNIKNRYETLHLDLLYTDKKQNFDYALQVLEKINNLFIEIDE